MVSDTESVKPLIQASLRYLAIRIRSRQEMASYLAKKAADPSLVEAVTTYLDDHHLLDDGEFARAWAESRLKKGKGDLIIKEELRLKGVAKGDVEQALASIDPEVWHQSLEKVALKYRAKWSGLAGFRQRARLMQILYARGFSSRHIDAYLRHALK